ncbi:unnamed protein product [Camellia sinensis]
MDKIKSKKCGNTRRDFDLIVTNAQTNEVLRDENGHIIEHTEVRFPSVGTETDIEIFWGVICSNLVANNFTVESSNNRYYNFSIKCGGPQITSNNQIIYERYNETLGPASYYVTSENRCAVSNVLLFIDSSQPQYRSFSLCVRDLRLGFDPEEKGEAAGMRKWVVESALVGGRVHWDTCLGAERLTNNPRPVQSQWQGSNNGPPQKPAAASQPADNTTSI